MVQQSKVTGDKRIPYVPVLDTNEYAENDILVDTTEITNVVKAGFEAWLASIWIQDIQSQNRALELWFMRSNTSIGTFNTAENVTDAEGLEVICIIDILASDYVDEANWSRVQKRLRDEGMGEMVNVLDDKSTSIYLGIKFVDVTATTYGASDLRFKFGFMES